MPPLQTNMENSPLLFIELIVQAHYRPSALLLEEKSKILFMVDILSKNVKKSVPHTEWLNDWYPVFLSSDTSSKWSEKYEEVV